MWRQRGNNHAAASQRTPSVAGICQKLRRGERESSQPSWKAPSFSFACVELQAHFLGQDLSPKGEYRVSLIAFPSPLAWMPKGDSKTDCLFLLQWSTQWWGCAEGRGGRGGWGGGMRRWGYGPERWPQLKSRNVHWMSAVGQHIKNNSLYLHSSQLFM